jgi:hypothetical protein
MEFEWRNRRPKASAKRRELQSGRGTVRTQKDQKGRSWKRVLVLASIQVSRSRLANSCRLAGLNQSLRLQIEVAASGTVVAASVSDARRKGPLPDRTGVYVDELAFGVVAHAARTE